MTRNRAFGAVLCGALFVVGCATVEPTAAPTRMPAAAMPAAAVHVTAVAAAKSDLVSDAWVAFMQQRDAHVETLGNTLLACAKAKPSPECERRKETFEVAYALAALHRITNDRKYQDAARVAVDKRSLRKIDEADAYTSTWFLAFAREQELSFADDSLHSKANDVALRLEGWLAELDDYSFAQGSMFGNEKNVAFVLGTLWAWAQHTKDESMIGRLTSLTKDRMLTAEMDGWCPLPIDSEPENSEFLPPCLQRATTVLSVMPSKVSDPWLSQFLAAQLELQPIRDPKLSTHASLNFARAWSLWAVYDATADGVYRDLYVAHVTAQMEHLDRADPWQAAFGVHAIAQSY
jgi:hypothetical protein